jgi:hypothetical protein
VTLDTVGYAGMPLLKSGPHSLRAVTVTTVLNGQGQGAPSAADVALLMGNDLNMWESVYDQARQQRSAAARQQKAVLQLADWRKALLAPGTAGQLPSGPSSSS